MADPEKRRWTSAALYIVAIAMLLRFFDLPLKPLHHDEGVNTYFLSALLRDPATYRYDPANYHGPTLFYFAWLSTFVFGVSTVALRVVTAIAGLGTVLLILATRRYLGTRGALTAAVLLALSPGAVYFSRYFIHEALLVCFTLGVVIAIASWWQTGRPRDLLLAAVSAAMMTATKETAVISAGVLTIAAVCTFGLTGRWNTAAIRLTRRPLWTTVGALGVFLLVNVAFYTSFFTNWQGAIDALRTFAFWTRTGTRDHTHGWNAYFEWLGAMEFPLVVAGLAGACGALWRRDNPFAVCAGLWGMGMIAAYSIIPYKTPWLTLNMIVPLALSSGYLAELAWQRHQHSSRLLMQASAVVAVALLGYQAVTLNFWRYDDERYPYVYAHTHREVLDLVERVRQLSAENPNLSLAVLSKDQFPLSWYLRDFRTGYHGKVVVTRDPLVIVSGEQEFLLEILVGERYTKLSSYRLRPGVKLTLYGRPDLRGIGSAGPAF